MNRLVTLLSVVVAGACAKVQGPPVDAKATAVDSAEQVMFGVRAPITESGVRRGELVADTMYVFNDQTRFDFIKGRLDFNTPTGLPNGSMRANKGRYDTRSQILEGWGSVVVTTVDGKQLKSEHVIYSQSRDEISSDVAYELSGSGRRLTGVGFTADSKFNRYSCKSACSASGR